MASPRGRVSSGTAASPAKRPLERESDVLKVVTVGRDEKVKAVWDSLDSFIAPLPRDEFSATVFRKRAMAVRVHPHLRERRLAALRDAMDGFRPLPMLEESNSEQIHVWMKAEGAAPGTDGRVQQKSIRTDAAQAKACYDCGAALYFRGSELLESTLLPALAKDLGFGFGAFHRDGQRRAEIETFVARPGHVTQWHWDFQENFTVQLTGAKKWSFYPSNVANPHRACATHFNGPEHARTLHTQFQTVRFEQPDFAGVPADIEERCESVVLQPGDVLYHPAGMWHKVESIGDAPSLSINLSFFPATYADVITDALQHAMLTQPALRQRIVYQNAGDAQATLGTALAEARRLLDGLKPNDILPAAVCTPATRRPDVVVWDADGSVTADGAPVAGAVPIKELRRSPLSILSQTPAGVAFPVRLRVAKDAESDDDDKEAEDSSSGDDEDDDNVEEVTGMPGFQRFDLTGNFLAEDGAFNGPAVSCTFFVAKKNVAKMVALALLPAGGKVSITAAPMPIMVTLVSLGYLSQP